MQKEIEEATRMETLLLRDVNSLMESRTEIKQELDLRFTRTAI